MLVNRLPESTGRDLRELRLRQSMVGMLSITTGYAAPETIDAVERAAPLAEKSGSLAELINWVGSRSVIAGISGEWPAAVTLADEALQLALREGNPERLARMALRLLRALSLAISRAPRSTSQRDWRFSMTPVSGRVRSAASYRSFITQAITRGWLAELTLPASEWLS
jgi:hypothetical protein